MRAIDQSYDFMESYLDNYVGEWDNESGWHLSITRFGDKTCLVTLLANAQPITRPWFGDQPSTEMIGTYDAEYGLVVELWESAKGFSLHLDFEPRFALDEQNRDALVVGLSRFEKDHFLDEYYCLIGPLRHYVKATA